MIFGAGKLLIGLVSGILVLYIGIGILITVTYSGKQNWRKVLQNLLVQPAEIVKIIAVTIAELLYIDFVRAYGSRNKKILGKALQELSFFLIGYPLITILKPLFWLFSYPSRRKPNRNYR